MRRIHLWESRGWKDAFVRGTSSKSHRGASHESWHCDALGLCTQPLKDVVPELRHSFRIYPEVIKTVTVIHSSCVIISYNLSHTGLKLDKVGTHITHVFILRDEQKMEMKKSKPNAVEDMGERESGWMTLAFILSPAGRHLLWAGPHFWLMLK